MAQIFSLDAQDRRRQLLQKQKPVNRINRSELQQEESEKNFDGKILLILFKFSNSLLVEVKISLCI